MVEKLIFLRKVSIVSEYSIITGRGLQLVSAATEKARLPILSLVLGTKRCLERDDLEITEKCNRLTKYVGC